MNIYIIMYISVASNGFIGFVAANIKGKNSVMGKCLAKHKRGTQYSLHSSCGCPNFTLWKNGASCSFANNDFDSFKTALVTSKINDKRKKEYHSIRSYEANEAVRCYRDVHNNVDIHNQYLSYGHWDYRTRRKQMWVSIITL